MLENFAENLAKFRKLAGYSRKEVAEKLGVTEIYFGDFERGKRLPDARKIYTLADLFGITPNDLLNFPTKDFTIQKIFWADIGYTVKTLDSGFIELILPSAGTVVDESSVVTVKGVERKIIFPSVDSFINFSTDIQRQFKSDYISRINEELLLRYHKIEEGESKDLRIEEKPFIKSFVPMKS